MIQYFTSYWKILTRKLLIYSKNISQMFLFFMFLETMTVNTIIMHLTMGRKLSFIIISILFGFRIIQPMLKLQTKYLRTHLKMVAITELMYQIKFLYLPSTHYLITEGKLLPKSDLRLKINFYGSNKILNKPLLQEESL